MSDIVVLSIYKAQQRILRRKLAKVNLGKAAVHTVDSFQGKESPIVLLSIVRSMVSFFKIPDVVSIFSAVVDESETVAARQWHAMQ